MDAELDLIENANDLIAVHDTVDDEAISMVQDQEQEEYDESDAGADLQNDLQEETAGIARHFLASIRATCETKLDVLIARISATCESCVCIIVDKMHLVRDAIIGSALTDSTPACSQVALAAAKSARSSYFTITTTPKGNFLFGSMDAQYWQSDGPQPHHLNIHFFKMVSIVYMRVFLDFELDESYTPTKLQFLAGTGHHDLQDVCTMSFKEPKGWLEVDLSNAGGPNPFEDGDFDDEDPEPRKNKKRSRQPGHGPTLRCMLVQLRILENHQNGKDTHLRGLQLFAIDPSALKVRRKTKPSFTANGERPKSPKKRVASSTLSDAYAESAAQAEDPADEMQGIILEGRDSASPHAERRMDHPGTLAAQGPRPLRSSFSGTSKAGRKKARVLPMVGLREPDWMGEPTLR